MKNKLVLVSVFVFLGLVAVGTKVVIGLGQVIPALPRVSTACETKIGGILMGFNDGFSTLRSCPGNSRKVILGEEKTVSTDNGGIMGKGDIIFVNNRRFLTRDGSVWMYYETENGFNWVKESSKGLPVAPEEILNWNDGVILAKDGSVYVYGSGSVWVKAVPMPTPTI